MKNRFIRIHLLAVLVFSSHTALNAPGIISADVVNSQDLSQEIQTLVKSRAAWQLNRHIIVNGLGPALITGFIIDNIPSQTTHEPLIAIVMAESDYARVENATAQTIKDFNRNILDAINETFPGGTLVTAFLVYDKILGQSAQHYVNEFFKSKDSLGEIYTIEKGFTRAKDSAGNIDIEKIYNLHISIDPSKPDKIMELKIY